jgi:hypothetical protein
MYALPRNVWLLTISLSLFMSLSIFIVFIGGIIGQSLSPYAGLSTLPVAMLVIGTASSIFPVVYVMSKIGRKRTFLGVCTIANLRLVFINPVIITSNHTCTYINPCTHHGIAHIT